MESLFHSNGLDNDHALAAFLDQYPHFTDSKYFNALSEYQQECAENVIDFFATYLVQLGGQSLPNLSPEAVAETCGLIMPAKVVSDDPYFFAQIAPVLASFFRFLGEKNLLLLSEELANLVIEISPQIIANAADESLWGMGKTMAMSALEAGVNIYDETEMTAFMEYFNQQLEATFASMSEEEIELLAQELSAEDQAKFEAFVRANRDDFEQNSLGQGFIEN